MTCGSATPEIGGGCVIPSPLTADLNGGCNSDPPQFQNIVCGQTVCGTIWINEPQLIPSRDTDWYRFTLAQPGLVTLEVQAEFPVELFLFTDPGAACGIDLVTDAAATAPNPCEASISACLQPGVHYAVVTHRFSVKPELPFLLTCAATTNQYLATLTCAPGSPLCSTVPCPPAPVSLTQSQSQSIVVQAVTCSQVSGNGVTYSLESRFGRSFNLATGATAGQPLAISCVDAAIERNTGSSLTAELRVYRDINGGAPQVADLVLLGSRPVVIPTGFALGFVSATFDPPLHPPVDSTIFVELWIPQSTTGGVWPGSNAAGQSGPTYFRSAACTIPQWVTMASLGYPNQHNVMNVRGSIAVPCPADFNQSGSVNGMDLAILLGVWTGAATYAPCPPFRPQDLNQDCRVNGLDLAMLLGAWGPCP